MTTAARLARLESALHPHDLTPVGLTVDEKLAVLQETRYIEYRKGAECRCIVVSADAPPDVRRWLSQNAPEGYAVVLDGAI